MKKTIFKVDDDKSIMILSSIAIFLTFFSEYMDGYSALSKLIFAIKSFIVFCILLAIYKIDKTDGNFKSACGLFTSFFFINFILSLLFVVFSHITVLFGIAKFIFDLFHLFILLSSILLFVDSLFKYSYVDSKLYNSMMLFFYKIALLISTPILKVIDAKIGNKRAKF